MVDSVAGADGDFLYANQAVLEYTGLTKEEMKSGNSREVFHPEDLERLLDKRAAALSRGVRSSTNYECAEAGMTLLPRSFTSPPNPTLGRTNRESRMQNP
jgi:PAS domain-containing protein